MVGKILHFDTRFKMCKNIESVLVVRKRIVSFKIIGKEDNAY